ncbi:MAG: hypothetical protein ACREUP_00085 [Burkholderiales bacterium]
MLMTIGARLPGSAAMIAVLLAWGMAGPSTAAGGADAPRSASGSAGEPARQVWYSPRLLANVSVSERYVVIGVCEADGIREIAEILRRSDFEEMWAFLPRAHGTRDCQWHEIGREEKSESDSAYLSVDMAYLEALMAENPEIHVVHFHPLKYFECAAHAGCPQAAAASRGESFDPRWIADLIFSMPSPSDVHFMMDVTSRYHRRRQGRGTIQHKVVTPYGVVDYGLTDAGLAKFDSERFERSEGLYITWVMASRLANDHVEGVIKENPGSIDGAVRRLAQTLNTEFLRVAHSTLKQAVSSQPH